MRNPGYRCKRDRQKTKLVEMILIFCFFDAIGKLSLIFQLQHDIL